MMNSEQTVENLHVSKHSSNEMLPAALSADEKKWFDLFEMRCKQTERRYVVTWHMRIDLKIATQKINYHLSKLAAKGLLKKETSHYCTKFYYAADFKGSR